MSVEDDKLTLRSYCLHVMSAFITTNMRASMTAVLQLGQPYVDGFFAKENRFAIW